MHITCELHCCLNRQRVKCRLRICRSYNGLKCRRGCGRNPNPILTVVSIDPQIRSPHFTGGCLNKTLKHSYLWLKTGLERILKWKRDVSLSAVSETQTWHTHMRWVWHILKETEFRSSQSPSPIQLLYWGIYLHSQLQTGTPVSSHISCATQWRI